VGVAQEVEPIRRGAKMRRSEGHRAESMQTRKNTSAGQRRDATGKARWSLCSGVVSRERSPAG
jgi:hypothetical protein